MSESGNGDLMRELMGIFAEEAEERLQSTNRCLLELERANDQEDRERLLAVILREVHSLKGAAGSVDLQDVALLAHGLETFFGTVKESTEGQVPPGFDIAYQALDAIGSLVRAAHSGEPAGIDVSALSGILEGTEDHGDGATPAPEETVVRPSDDGATPLATADASTRPPAPHRVTAPQTNPSAPQPSAAPATKAGVPEAGTRLIEDSVRVATTKLDSLMAQVGELIAGHIGWQHRLTEVRSLSQRLGEWEDSWRRMRPQIRTLLVSAPDTESANAPAMADPARSDVTQLLPFLEEGESRLLTLHREVDDVLRKLEADNRRMGQVTEALQDDVRRTRMLPISTVFDAFPRVVRDLARELGKEVALVIRGADTEVDRSVLEQIRSPLVHVLRNSLDHGVEFPDERGAASKPREATLTVSASHRGGLILIEITDDGRGIDIERVKARAIRSGIVTPEAAEAMSDRDAMRLIFRSGFSTTEEITDVSGRGVGLDVVRESVERLQGMVEVESEPGGGTRFVLSLPLTVATTHCLIVRSAGQTFAIPIANVLRILRVEADQIASTHGREALRLDSGPVPVVRLSDVLQLEVRMSEAHETIVTRQPAILLGSAERSVAFLVDSLAGTQEVVIKSLPRPLVRVPYAAGATIMGTGEVVMILNVADLIVSAGGSATQFNRPQRAAADVAAGTARIMVVDDSIVTRMLEKSILEAAGYEVRVASDGIEAWNLLQSAACDLMVSDINMPKMDGLKLTEKVRGSDTFKNLPIILVTSLDTPEDRERGVEAGADAYIVKSAFSQDGLLDAIRRLI